MARRSTVRKRRRLTEIAKLARVWRVGFHTSPLDFTPWNRCTWTHRFDDPDRRWRTIYCSIKPETCLREVLADFRPNLAEISNFLKEMGEEAGQELVEQPVTAAWRRVNVLAPGRMVLSGSKSDLTDVEQRHELEQHNLEVLTAHGMAHLDIHEITTRRRSVTQVIAADVFDRLAAAAIRYPSRTDGIPCYAVFEGRGHLAGSGDPVLLTDPAPEALLAVARSWRLRLEPAPVRVEDFAIR